MPGARYHIADEPTPGAWAAWAVSPFWPMLATMLAGSWLGAPWFVVNAIALGSATRGREIGWAVASVAGSLALALALVLAAGHALVPGPAVRYVVVLVTAWRLFAAYRAYADQAASAELHQHFGGALRNGAPIALLGMFLPLDRALGEVAWFFHLVLGG
jgi:hypothetical protein